MANSGVRSLNNFRKNVSKVYDLISTSYHEAGHAIYGLLHCMKVESVYIFESKQTKKIGGFTHYDSTELNDISDPSLFSAALKAEICVFYAGLVAEKYQFKLVSGSDNFPIFLRDGSSEDTMSAAALIRQYNVAPPGRKRYEYKKKLINEVGKELDKNWEAVTIIAHALFKRKKLYYSDIKELLIKKTKNKDFWKEQFKAINYIYDNKGPLDEKSLKSILT